MLGETDVKKDHLFKQNKKWRAQKDLNPQPLGPQPNALSN